MLASSNHSALVADIGGTHARFALASLVPSGQPVITGVEQYRTADFESLTAAAQHYLKQPRAESAPLRAVMAVASAVTGDHVKITNNPWSFSVDQLRRDLGFASIRVINDFAAVSMALPVLQPADLQALGAVPATTGTQKIDRTFAVLGPGTGLGVGGLALRGTHAAIIESEGGHVGFSPTTPYEADVMRHLMARYGRVSAERLISGMGMINLYQAVCALEGVTAELQEAAQIAAQANAEPDSICARVLKLFCEILGGFAGDIALAFGAWDGVFLTGGVAQKMLPWLQAGGFRQRFEEKGRHQVLMRSIPTQIIIHPHAGLLGAAAHLSAEVTQA